MLVSVILVRMQTGELTKTSILSSRDEPTRRDRKRQATREAILTTALQLFAEQGFAATTVEDIAYRADVAPRTFFRYFDNKAAVLQPTSETYREAFRTTLAAQPRDTPVLEALHHAVRSTLVLFHDERERFVLKHRISMEAGLDLGGEEFTNLWHGFQADVAERMGVGGDDDDPRPALLTGLAVGIATGAIHRWLLDDARGDLGVLVDEGFAALGSLVAEVSEPA